MNKKVLASIISLSAVGVLGVGIVCANADKSPVPDIPKTAENGAAMLSTENFQDISGRLEQNQSSGSEITRKSQNMIYSTKCSIVLIILIRRKGM